MWHAAQVVKGPGRERGARVSAERKPGMAAEQAGADAVPFGGVLASGAHLVPGARWMTAAPDGSYLASPDAAVVV
jgi:hypothetical protein